MIEAEGARESEQQGHIENGSWRLLVILILKLFDLPVVEDADEVDEDEGSAGQGEQGDCDDVVSVGQSGHYTVSEVLQITWIIL